MPFSIMMNSSSFLKRKNLAYYLLFFICFVFFLQPLHKQLKSIDNLFRMHRYSEGEILRFKDRNFYVFMQICLKLIPENSDIIFEINSEGVKNYDKRWFKREYYLQRSPSYLHPRSIFRYYWIKKQDEKLLILNRHSKEWIEHKSIDYKIVYDLQSDRFYLYFKDSLLIAYGVN